MLRELILRKETSREIVG